MNETTIRTSQVIGKNTNNDINLNVDDEVDVLKTLSTSSLKAKPVNKEPFNFKKLIECHKLTLINTVSEIGDFCFDTVLTACFDKRNPIYLHVRI